jgi:hypothetical protein
MDWVLACYIRRSSLSEPSEIFDFLQFLWVMMFYRRTVAALLFLFSYNYVFSGERETIYVFDSAYHQDITVRYRFAKVVDQRPVKDDLGFVKLGAFRKVSQLVTSKPFAEELGAYANSMRKTPDATDTLLLILHDFQFAMIAKDDLAASFHFRGDFYLGQNGAYKLVQSVDSIYEAGAKDVANRIQVVGNQKLVEYLGSASQDNSDAQPVYTMQEAIDRYQKKRSTFPVYTAGGAFKKGIYYTMQDFLHQRAVDTPFKQVDKYEGAINRPNFYYKRTSGWKGEKIEQAFAIYNGKDWFRPGKHGWRRIKYEHGEFYSRQTSQGITTRKNNTGSVVAAGLLFGVVGAVIADAATHHSFASEDTGLCVYEARFEPETGAFLPVKRLE